ncbi:MAG: enoyl-CoA hydratase-related protein [Alcaligenaceae bacterium]
MSESLVLTDRLNDCLIIRLNRPQDGNAINLSMAQALAALIQDCSKDLTLRAVILTGSGNKFFCAGGDVKAYAKIETEVDLNEVFDTIRNLLDSLEQLPCPVIAAINGYAIGGGAELTLACDFRIIEHGAQLGFPQSRLGILPGWNGISRLVPLIGRAAAAKLLFDGRRINAEQALNIGLATAVAPAGECLRVALELADSFSGTAPLSIAAIKAELNAVTQNLGDIRAQSRRAFAELWFTADHKEAEKAFAEKRLPSFKGL